MQKKKLAFTPGYFPGIISLVCLPLLCIGYFAYTTGFKQLAMMNVAWADKDYMKRVHFNENDFEKKNLILVFTNNQEANEKKLIELNKKCRRLIKDSHNETQGVTVIFENNASYGDLIKVLDVGYSFENQISFLPYNNKMYFIRSKSIISNITKQRQKSPLIFCGTSDVMIEYNQENSAINKLLGFLSRFWPSMIALISMIFFALRKNRKFAV
jgi:hypothetical protein